MTFLTKIVKVADESSSTTLPCCISTSFTLRIGQILSPTRWVGPTNVLKGTGTSFALFITSTNAHNTNRTKSTDDVHICLTSLLKYHFVIMSLRHRSHKLLVARLSQLMVCLQLLLHLRLMTQTHSFLQTSALRGSPSPLGFLLAGFPLSLPASTATSLPSSQLLR